MTSSPTTECKGYNGCDHYRKYCFGKPTRMARLRAKQGLLKQKNLVKNKRKHGEHNDEQPEKRGQFRFTNGQQIADEYANTGRNHRQWRGQSQGDANDMSSR